MNAYKIVRTIIIFLIFVAEALLNKTPLMAAKIIGAIIIFDIFDCVYEETIVQNKRKELQTLMDNNNKIISNSKEMFEAIKKIKDDSTKKTNYTYDGFN